MLQSKLCICKTEDKLRDTKNLRYLVRITVLDKIIQTVCLFLFVKRLSPLVHVSLHACYTSFL